MYCNYKYIVKISVSQLAKLAQVPKPVAAASLILLNSSKGSSAPPAQTPARANSSGLCRATPTFPPLKWESCGQILHAKAGNLLSSISSGKILTYCTVLTYQIHEDGIENSGTSFLHHQAEFLISHVWANNNIEYFTFEVYQITV